jgi:hypothetical protein
LSCSRIRALHQQNGWSKERDDGEYAKAFDSDQQWWEHGKETAEYCWLLPEETSDSIVDAASSPQTMPGASQQSSNIGSRGKENGEHSLNRAEESSLID